MFKKLIILLLFLPTVALATGGPDWGNYPQQPAFQLGDYSDSIRLLGGYAATVTLGLILSKDFKVDGLEAAVLSTLIIGGLGTLKDTLNPSIASGTYVKCWWLGAATGGFTVVIINF